MLLAAPSSVVHAQSTSAPEATPSADTDTSDAGHAAVLDPLELARQARSAFEAGLQHFQLRRYREAIRSFQRAAELAPSADLWFNVARAHEELGEWDAAVAGYRRYLRDRVDPPDRLQVEGRIASLEERAEADRANLTARPTTGTLALRVAAPGAVTTVDGRAVGPATDDGVMSMPPGAHRLEVTRDGDVPFVAEVAVEAGLRTVAHAELQRATRYAATRRQPAWAWGAFGLAGASAGVSVGLGVDAASRSAGERAAALDVAGYADVALGVAIGLAAVGLVVWFVEEAAVDTVRVADPTPAP